MIKNQSEYQITQEWLDKFKEAIAPHKGEPNLTNNDAQKWHLNRDALQSHVQQLQAEIAEYERLKDCHSSQPIQISVESLTKLPEVLIKARIAASLSQEEVAKRLGIEPERVYRYEESNYKFASFLEILEVATVLGISLEMGVVKVDFAEIEAVKQTAMKLRQNNSQKPVNC